MTKKNAIHPGLFIRDYMDDYSLTASALAKAIGVGRSAISDLLHQKRGLSPEMSLRLGTFFGGGAKLWMNIQQEYEWDRLSERKDDVIRGIMPVGEWQSTPSL
jgi:antitoxin HigA-1